MAWVDRGGGVVWVLWATVPAADSAWVQYTITGMADVRAMPRKPAPGDADVPDGQPGWVAALNIQGVTMTGDHIGFSLDGQGRLVVGCWNDDPADWPFEWGVLRTFDSPALDPTLPVPAEYATVYPEACGEITPGQWVLWNTRQTAVAYVDKAACAAAIAADPAQWGGFQRYLDDPATLDMADWPKFNPNNILHGVWMSDPDWQTLVDYQRGNPHVWPEWV